MGCSHSTETLQSIVTHCKHRKRSMEKFMNARLEFSTAHMKYIHSLREISRAFHTFADTMGQLYGIRQLLPPQEGRDNGEIVEVVNENRHLMEVFNQFSDQFQQAANAGPRVSELLPDPSLNSSNERQSLISSARRWVVRTRRCRAGSLRQSLISSVRRWVVRMRRCRASLRQRLRENPQAEADADGVGGGGHEADGVRGGGYCSNVDMEMFLSLEKRLYQEVKNTRNIKLEHEKKVKMLRKLEIQLTDPAEIERIRIEANKLKSDMMVASMDIDNYCEQIRNLRRTNLYPQLMELVHRLMEMWTSMHMCHQAQIGVVQHLGNLRAETIPSNNLITDGNIQSAITLEIAVKNWQWSFCNLFKAQCGYFHYLQLWLRFSPVRLDQNPCRKSTEELKIESLCNQWCAVVDRFQDNSASKGIHSLTEAINFTVGEQTKENNMRIGLQSTRDELQAVQRRPEGLDAEEQIKVIRLRRKEEEQQAEYNRSMPVIRLMVLTRLHMGCDEVFQAIADFSSVSMNVFRTLHQNAQVT